MYIRLHSKEIEDSTSITLTYTWKEKHTYNNFLKSSINQHKCNRVGVWLKNTVEKQGQMRLSQRLLTGNYKSGFERNISEITINEIS